MDQTHDVKGRTSSMHGSEILVQVQGQLPLMQF